MVNRLIIYLGKNIAHCQKERTIAVQIGESYHRSQNMAQATHLFDVAFTYDQRRDLLTLLLLATPPSRPTSAPAAIRRASVAVEVADLPAPTNTNDDAKNPPVIEIKRFIGGNFQAVTINDELTLVPANGAIAKALPTAPVIVDIDHLLPARTSDNQNTVDYANKQARRQMIIWEKFDNGEWKAHDFCPQLPPKPVVKHEPRQHSYDGRYYGSSSYYMRNR